MNKKIKELRKDKNITQIELAAAAGVAVNTIRLYESGKVAPRTDTLAKIAAALDVPVELLLLGSDGVQQSDALRGIPLLLKSIYGSYQEKEVAIHTPDATICSPYYVIGTGANSFVLYEDDLLQLFNNVKLILPSWVDLMKDERPLEEIEKQLEKECCEL